MSQLQGSFGFVASSSGLLERDAPAETEDEIAVTPPELRSYAQSPAWTSTCEGPSVTQADLSALLGDRAVRALGRFEIVTRDLCSPWVNGRRSCGPSGESREASTGDAKFAFGLEPSHTPSVAPWQFFRGPLLVHDRGAVLARRVGSHVVVQLVGDVSAVEIGTEREMNGRVTGSARLRGRLLSSDLVRDEGNVRGLVRAATGRDGTKIGATDLDVETLRWTSPPAPLADLARAATDPSARAHLAALGALHGVRLGAMTAALEGREVRLPDDALGPCFRVPSATHATFDLGFDAPATSESDARTVRGLVSGGPAAVAGLRATDVLEEALYREGNAEVPAKLVVTRNGQRVTLTFKPQGTKRRGPLWTRSRSGRDDVCGSVIP